MPEWHEEIRSHLAELELEPTREAEIVEELALHLEACYNELVSDGADESEVHSILLAELGDTGLLAQELEQTETAGPERTTLGEKAKRNVMSALWNDMRYAVRQLHRDRSFTVVAAVTLALAIGANTAIFSVVYRALLNPLPYRYSDRLVEIRSVNPKFGNEFMDVPYGDFIDISSHKQSFAEVAAYRQGFPMTMTGGGPPVAVRVVYISPNLLSVLGVNPALGRPFTADEALPGGGRAAILSHSLWQTRFGASTDVLGKTVSLNKTLFTVVGVMPANFSFSTPGQDIWVPLTPSFNDFHSRSSRNCVILARLKPGVGIEQSNAQIQSIGDRLAHVYPSDHGWQLTVVSLRQVTVERYQSALWMLFGAIGFVLLIACANISNLLLARGANRQHEIAIRETLGASRARILQQLLTENLVLAIGSGALGLLLIPSAIRLIRELAPASIPLAQTITINIGVLWFCITVSLASAVLFGLIPAFHVSNRALLESLKQRHASFGLRIRRPRLANLLVVSEIALALVLMSGAGLLLRSFWRLMNVDPGFDPQNVLTLRISRPFSEMNIPHKTQLFFQQVVERVKTLPGVRAVALSNVDILAGSAIKTSLMIEGQASFPERTTPDVQVRIVSPGFFFTLGIPLANGRDFTEDDTWQEPLVVIINRSLARRFWPGENPIGKHIKLGWAGLGKSCKIIGIVDDSRDVALEKAAEPEVYAPYLQAQTLGMDLVVRTTASPRTLVNEIRSQVWSIDKDQPVPPATMLQHALSMSVAGPRFRTILLTIFASLALILALVGIYGVMSYTVSHCNHEIGIRMALGALKSDMLKMVLRQGMVLAGVGVGVGLAGSLCLTRVLSSMLYGISSTDPLTFVIAAGLLLAVGLLASYIPARRAAFVDPMTTLRNE
ncbi:MAG: ABC transporter permease [Acidobacteria bacterium]|nr:MAG: ABC transporter permease [Acidobacteriota bacterium]